MKRSLFIALVLIIVFNLSAHAFETSLLDMRKKISTESTAIKPLLANSKDLLLVSSMWDTCIIAVSQLDAYFHMVGIFNAIKEDSSKPEAIAYLIRWLNEIKKNNVVNIKSLKGVTYPAGPDTKKHMDILINYFSECNVIIDAELKKLSGLRDWTKR